MKRTTAVLAVAVAVAALVAVPVAGGARVRHHPQPKPWSHQRIVSFYQSGTWARRTSARVGRARSFLTRELAGPAGRHHRRGSRHGDRGRGRRSHGPSRGVAFTGSARRGAGDRARARKLAVVFDIDDTLLSSYRCEKSFAGGFGPTANALCVAGSELRPIRQTRSLLRYAVRRGVPVYLITGRPEAIRTLTIDQLDAAGIHGYRRLILKPADYHKQSIVPYKSGARRKIERSGHTIAVNMGDQWSDLEGGFSKRAYKIPNPMYFLP